MKKGMNVIKRVACMVVSGLIASATLASGDPMAGQAKAVSCVACHNTDGNSLVPTFPKLAGQHERYLLKQMQDIQSGARAIPTMMGQLDALKPQDLQDVAAYFATQKTTPALAKDNADALRLGESIYRAGIREIGVAACSACHSPTGAGNGPAKYPKLSGQYADYIAATLRAFRSEERKNDGDTRIMRDVVRRMSDKEIDAVASYASALR
jgi:cytochrome c553